MSSWKDAFGAYVHVGTLVTYAMKSPGGGSLVFPVARVLRATKNNPDWLDVELDADWLAEQNRPTLERIAKTNADPNWFGDVSVLTGQLLKKKVRSVAALSLIRIDTHPAFAKPLA